MYITTSEETGRKESQQDSCRGGQVEKTARDCSAAPSRPSHLTCCSLSPGDPASLPHGNLCLGSHILKDASPDSPGLSTAPTTSLQYQLNHNYTITGAPGACLHRWNLRSVWAVYSQMYSQHIVATHMHWAASSTTLGVWRAHGSLGEAQELQPPSIPRALGHLP